MSYQLMSRTLSALPENGGNGVVWFVLQVGDLRIFGRHVFQFKHRQFQMLRARISIRCLPNSRTPKGWPKLTRVKLMHEDWKQCWRVWALFDWSPCIRVPDRRILLMLVNWQCNSPKLHNAPVLTEALPKSRFKEIPNENDFCQLCVKDRILVKPMGYTVVYVWR